MNKLILILAFICLGIQVNGQAFTYFSDGQKLKQSYSFFNENRKKESSVTDYISLYQQQISGIRGHECPMYPSCSNYGLKVFQETSFTEAFLLTSDRLLRCGHDRDYYALTLNKSGFKYIDYPVYDTIPRNLEYTGNRYFYAYTDLSKPDSTLKLIKNLINNEYYQEALLEIIRVENTRKITGNELFINKIICLHALGHYEKAIFEYETKAPGLFKNEPELLYQVALVQEKLANYAEANALVNKALIQCQSCPAKPKLLSFKALLYAKQHNWQASAETYRLLSGFDNYVNPSKSAIVLLSEAEKMRFRSPALAGAISIIPGAGYWYAGHKQTAVAAFIMNGLLTFATYSNLKKENYGMAALTGVFNLSFYLGNITGAIKSTKRFNEKRKENIVRKLQFNSHL